MSERVREVVRGLRWYLRECTGEARWYEYFEDCRRLGVEPISRREFERHRADHRERHPQSRCC